ncbi:hypothetical protein CDAR_30771 [Caerostris darwini]|uniref:Uncharacterized protein n=1 Tax=Caerostris darwini TaxID=1538125 RepID=A0AAV4SEK1_9ARAC|nr:hypothetical protein CDAR_30771 [Caerostris darwini]
MSFRKKTDHQSRHVMHSDPFDPFLQPLSSFFRENFTGVLVSQLSPGYVKDVYPLLPFSDSNVNTAELFPLKSYVPIPSPLQSIPFHNFFCSKTSEEGGEGFVISFIVFIDIFAPSFFFSPSGFRWEKCWPIAYGLVVNKGFRKKKKKHIPCYVMHSDPFDPFFQPLSIFFRENFTGVLVSQLSPGNMKDVYPLLPGSGTNVNSTEQFPLKPYIPRPPPL